MTRRSLEDAVALLDLPSWEHVGAELLSHGITDGEQENCERCPIAQFLQLLTGRKVSVGQWSAYYGGTFLRSAPLPAAAMRFIGWFDNSGHTDA